MADKDLRRRTTPVFPRTRSSTNDATSRSDYDLENRSLSAAGTDPLAELERLVGEIDSFVKIRAGADRGSEVNNNDYSSQSDAVEKDVDAQIYDEVDSAGRQQHEAEYYDDERGITDRNMTARQTTMGRKAIPTVTTPIKHRGWAARGAKP